MTEPDQAREVELRRLRALNRILKTLVNESNYDVLLNLIMGELLVALGAERGFLVVGNSMEIRAVRNWSAEEISAAPGEVSRSIVRDVVKSGKPILLQDALHSPYGKFQSVQELQLASILAAPIPDPHEKEPLGVLYLEARATVAVFTEDDLALTQEVLELSGKVLDDVVRRDTMKKRAQGFRIRLAGSPPIPWHCHLRTHHARSPGHRHPGRGNRCAGSCPRGVRHRKRIDRPSDPPEQPGRGRSLFRDQLRGVQSGASGVGTVWAHGRCFYRGGSKAQRPGGSRVGRHVVFRRARGNASQPASEIAPHRPVWRIQTGRFRRNPYRKRPLCFRHPRGS